MRIAYIADGSSVHTHKWIAYFADRGHDVHLLSHTPYTGGHPGVVVHRLPALYSLPLLTSRLPKVRVVEHFLRHCQLLRVGVRALNPDVVHVHFLFNYGAFGFLVRQCPLVVTPWGTDIFSRRSQSWAMRAMISLTLRSADLVAGNSDDLLKTVVRLGVDSRKTRLVGFGVDTTRFRPAEDREAIRRELGFGPSDRVVLSSRAVRAYYNIDTIVRSFAEVARGRSELRLVIKDGGGWPEYKAGIRKLVDELGLTDRVTFLEHGPQDEMVKLYNAADVVVSLAQTDNAPLTLLESMACGALVVGSDLPSLREWVRDGENGFLAPPADRAAVAAKLRQALDQDPAVIRRWARTNVELVRQRGDYWRQMETMERLYEQLMPARPKTS